MKYINRFLIVLCLIAQPKLAELVVSENSKNFTHTTAFLVDSFRSEKFDYVDSIYKDGYFESIKKFGFNSKQEFDDEHSLILKQANSSKLELLGQANHSAVYFTLLILSSALMLICLFLDWFVFSKTSKPENSTKETI